MITVLAMKPSAQLILQALIALDSPRVLLTVPQIAKRIGISCRTVERGIHELQSQGKIRRTGGPRGYNYEINVTESLSGLKRVSSLKLREKVILNILSENLISGTRTSHLKAYELASLLQCEASTIQRVLRSLESKNYIYRDRSRGPRNMQIHLVDNPERADGSPAQTV